MVKMEFRDGERDVLEHVAAMLSGVDTFAYTYEEAVRLSETMMLRRRLDAAQDRIIERHLKNQTW